MFAASIAGRVLSPILVVDHGVTLVRQDPDPLHREIVARDLAGLAAWVAREMLGGAAVVEVPHWRQFLLHSPTTGDWFLLREEFYPADDYILRDQLRPTVLVWRNGSWRRSALIVLPALREAGGVELTQYEPPDRD